MPEVIKTERVLMIDVIRAVLFPAIVIFHMTYALWGRAGFDVIPDRSFSTQVLETYGRTFAISGFTVLFLSFFLFGYRAEKRWIRLGTILFGFFVVWAAVGGEFPYVWDIYPFLLVAIVLARLTKNWSGQALAIVGALIVSTPFWQIEVSLNWSPLFTGSLFGNCAHSGGIGEEWPLLPWIGYPLFALGVGGLAQQYSARLQTMTRTESALWAVALATSFIFLGGYFSTPIGDHFACYMFRRPTVEFWSHQLWPIFLMRIGLLSNVNDWLMHRSFSKRLSGLMINRRFFIAYFVQYPYCLAWAALAPALSLSPAWIFGLGVISCLLCAELVPRLLNQVNRVNRTARADFELQLRERRL